MSDSELPTGIELAWGRRPRSARGPRPGLTVEQIVGAAVAIAESEGLSAVSMSRVAADVGVSSMALYRYVASKDELLMLMIDLPFEAPPEPAAGQGWRAAMTQWANSHRALLQRHPWVLRVPISGPPITPNQLAWMDAGLRTLAGTTLDEGQKVGAILLVSGYVRNETTLMADLAAGESNSTLLQIMNSYGALLDELADERFPALRKAIDAGVFDTMAEDPPDDDYLFGLERILDGLEALMAA